jgi:hypothetical protein
MKTQKSQASPVWRYASMLLICVSLSGCAQVGIGFSVPIGPFGSLGVNVGSDGRLGGSVGVGYGPASVQVGTSVQLPPAKAPVEEKK